MVVPRRHVESPAELRAEELQEIFEEIGRLEQIMLESGLATGCDIRQNYRPFLEQSRTKVDHLHFHVLPRTFEDELCQKSMKYEYGIFDDLGDQEAKQMKKLLK